MIPSDDHPFIVLAETKLGISPLQSPKEEQEQGCAEEEEEEER